MAREYDLESALRPEDDQDRMIACPLYDPSADDV
jgi:hypothetical protein